jgi:pimeloyl-ACP methyl ester carboxylesterase
MGGHTAMLAAAWQPGLVRRLVLLGAGVGGYGAEDYPAKLGVWFASWPVPFPDVQTAAAFLGSTPIARSSAGDLEERVDGLWPRFEPDVMRAAIAAVAEKGAMEGMATSEGSHLAGVRPERHHRGSRGAAHAGGAPGDYACRRS